MITLPKTKLEKVCGKADGRPTLKNPYLQVNKSIGKNGLIDETPGYGTLMATNGFVLAVLPVEHDDSDASGSIPNDAIKAALKIAKKNTATLDLDTVERQTHFLKVEQILSGRDQDTISIGIDVDRLLDLADALCERASIYKKPLRYIKLTIGLDRKNGPILVEPIDSDSKGFGLLMPIHIRD